jgi:hypothetical protein
MIQPNFDPFVQGLHVCLHSAGKEAGGITGSIGHSGAATKGTAAKSDGSAGRCSCNAAHAHAWRSGASVHRQIFAQGRQGRDFHVFASRALDVLANSQAWESRLEPELSAAGLISQSALGNGR